MFAFRIATAALIAAAMAGGAPAAERASRKLAASELLAEAARTGLIVGPTEVEEDIDLARIVGPSSSATVTFQEVNFRGRLVGAPRVPLSVIEGSICAIEAERSEWTRRIELRGVALGTVRLRDARLEAPWACLECTVCRAGFESARFADQANFIRTRFGWNDTVRMICRGPAQPVCAQSDFAEAIFAGAARFDSATFQTAGSFDGADFGQGARFPRASATAPLSFIGARFRRDAEFRDCRFAGTYFGPLTGNTAATTEEVTEFASRSLSI
jgi:hypothetical protein